MHLWIVIVIGGVVLAALMSGIPLRATRAVIHAANAGARAGAAGAIKPHSWAMTVRCCLRPRGLPAATTMAVMCLLIAGCRSADDAAGVASVPSGTPGAMVPAVDIHEWFAAYYAYAKADLQAHPQRYLPVIFNAVDAGADAERLLADGQLARVEAIDHRVGFLALGGALDDSELTMAVYLPAHGTPRLLVSSSICVDGCDQHVEVFTREASGQLALLPGHGMLPTIAPEEFLRPGVAMPLQFQGVTPLVDYRPQADGRGLVASAWFGDEAEDAVRQSQETADGVTRPLALRWDAASGVFARP